MYLQLNSPSADKYKTFNSCVYFMEKKIKNCNEIVSVIKFSKTRLFSE